MEIRIERIAQSNKNYTLGKMTIVGSDGEVKMICDTLEDTDRGLTSDMTIEEIKRLKVPHKTAIPKGKYEVCLTMSNRFKRILPLVVDVRGYAGVRIHSGNTADDSDGCILVGQCIDPTKGFISNSRSTMDKLMEVLSIAKKSDEQIWLTIF